MWTGALLGPMEHISTLLTTEPLVLPFGLIGLPAFLVFADLTGQIQGHFYLSDRS